MVSLSTLAQEPILQTEVLDDPSELIQDFLLGSGILIENVSMMGHPEQVGAFSNGLLEAGIYEGVVMSSALVTPFDGTSDVPFGEGADGDEDLLNIANLVPGLIGQQFFVSGVYNMAVLEFDFIPYGDSLAFNYGFASSEYSAWENSSFNDVFAFFLSGPGIEGPYSSPDEFPGGAVNIAYVPGSDPELPITVSSVQANYNSEFFVPTNDMPYLPFTGRTVPFTASYGGLQIGETYHIRLAIADGSDMALASYVFLEAGSFSSNQEVDEDTSVADLNNDGVLNVEDLLLIIGQFGCEGDCVGDFDNSGAVDVGDILFFLGLFD